MTQGRHAAPDGSFRRSAGAAAGRGIVLLGVAVVLGIVLLSATDAQPPGERVTAGRDTEQPDDEGEGDEGEGDETPVHTTVPTTTTAPTRQPRDVKVLVVNASGVGGVAGKITDQLRPGGYNLLAPGNATQRVNDSSVLFTPGFDREAAILASAIGLPAAAVKPVPTPPPLRDTRAANILVMVGRDLAAKVGPATTTSTTARARTTTTTTAATSTTSTSTTRQP